MAKVVYWSQTGNTQTMAEAVAKGITAAGGSAECVAVSDIHHRTWRVKLYLH